MNSKKQSLRKTSAKILAFVLVAVMVLALPAAAYDRQEATKASGGTEITVYTGTQNSNDKGNYLADPGDYMQVSRFWTAGKLESTSNITSSTNFDQETAPGKFAVRGGVEGVFWDAARATLTLNNASGTVITIEGPEIDVAHLNTYNSHLSTVIDITMPNLTYYKQFDMFTSPDGQEQAPHTKDNATEQDVITINLVGENSFNNIRMRGNVKVVFTGDGSLTLDASQDWNYDNYEDPDFDDLSNPCGYAISSYPTIGFEGSLEGEGVIEDTMPNGMKRTVTELYTYGLPAIALDGVKIAEGGTVRKDQVKNEAYFTFSGKTAPTDESRLAAEHPDGLDNTYALRVNGTAYNMVYNDAKDAFYVTVQVGMGGNAPRNYYDVTADIKSWEPWESFIGAAGAPAKKVVLTGGSATKASAVEVSAQTLTVDGREVICEKYNIDGHNYLKLRDLAAIFSGTAAQFGVSFDGATMTVTVATGQAYTPVGGEQQIGEDRSATCVSSDWKLVVDGKPVTAQAYNLGGNNYFKLRDLGEAIGFGVDYIEETNTAIVTTKTA